MSVEAGAVTGGNQFNIFPFSIFSPPLWPTSSRGKKALPREEGGGRRDMSKAMEGLG